jgi:hypothetical protein
MEFSSVATSSTGVALQGWCPSAVKPMWFSRINAGKVPAPYLFRGPLDEKCEITLAYLCSYQLDPFCGHLQSSVDTAEAILRVAWPDPQFSS